MKIIYFHQYFSTNKGSNGTRSFEFAKKLIQNGHEVTVVCLNTDRSSYGKLNKNNKFNITEVEGIKVVEFNIKYSNSMGFLKRGIQFADYAYKSIRYCLGKNYDLVFCTSTPLTAGIPGIFLKLSKGTPFIFEVRDLWPELPRAMGIIKNKLIFNILKILERLTYFSADHIIGLSPGICESFKNEGIPTNKISFIPNFSDLDLFKPSVRSIDSKENKKFNAVFCGAHGIANGLESVLNAAEILKSENRKDIVFTFIGDGKMKNKLIEIADTKNLDNCFFLPPMPKFLLADYLKESTNIGLMILKNIPAFYEGTSPNKFFDYISSGLPVLINYPGWISETIKKYNMGISVKPENPSEFANGIKKIADNKFLQTKMGKSSREVAVKYFSSNDLSDKFLNILEDNYKKYNSRRNNYLRNLFYIFLKTTFDKTFAFFLLITSLPLLFLLGFLVKINLGTPIFFKQLRPGFRNKPFFIYKFRTMRDLYNENGSLIEDEMRLTKFGKWLRSTSLDELPSLINILKGEMSFIGPRPLLMEYLEQYSNEQIRRHNVKPGFSGWAQINGRNSLTWEDKFKLDVWYVDNRSLYLDLKIFIITIIKVLKRANITPKNNEIMPVFKNKKK